MSRSIWKLPYISLLLFKKKFLVKENINIKQRNSNIPTIFINKKIKINIYNGIWYLSTILSNTMSKFKLGEFAYTKRSDTQTHLKKKRKKKTKNKK
jgi:ribosomal protein S19